MPDVQYTSEITHAFRSRQRKQLWSILPIFIAVGCMIYFEESGAQSMWGMSKEALGALFIAVVAGIAVFSFFNWRCPQCKKYLGKRFNPKYCWHCGVELRR